MQKIPFISIKRWLNLSNYHIPVSISSYCPYCGERVIFALTSHFYDPHRNAQYSSSNCPSCDSTVSFFTMSPWNTLEEEERDPEAIFMYPPIKSYRHVKDYSKYIPENLQKAYESTLNSYNSKNYIATAVSCRRTLEGIFHYLLAEKKEKVLAKSIEKAKTEIDWSAPLNTLAHMIRHGGNLGAHFDEEKEPNEEVAKSMVELLEYLLEYIYELPADIEELKNNLDKA